MRAYVVDHRKDRPSPRPGVLFDRALRLLDTPRLTPLCRLLGHRPVVDGTSNSLWVCCDRCGVRADPQGSLDPGRWKTGDRYSGPWGAPLPEGRRGQETAIRALKGRSTYAPGPWQRCPVGDIGVHLVLGRTFWGTGVAFEVGCAGNEHTVSASLRLHNLGALHVYSNRHGTWLQRRLNGAGYDNRVVEFMFEHRGFRWKLWTRGRPRDRALPRWRDGQVGLDPREWLFGEVATRVEQVGVPEEATVRMPHGDDHDVVLQLQRCTTGRPRSRRGTGTWVVEWACAGGIPCRHDDGWTGGSLHGSDVEVSDSSVEDGSWPEEAAALIAARMTRDRARYGYRPNSIRG